MLTDGDLVARYAASHSAEDFAEIVARHGSMVLRTCQRLCGNLSDAEDAAQAAFLVVAQKAGSVRDKLAGWLHKVARDCAGQLVRERVRRARREEESARMKRPPRKNLAELREELDAALVRLPERLREAVVLRYLEGRPGDEAARLAGCNEATLRWRAMKGLEQLRALLGRRGAGVTTSAVVLLLSEEAAAAAASAKLTAWAATVAAGTEVTGWPATLAKSMISASYWAPAKAAAVTLAAATALAGLTIPWILRDNQPPATPPAITGVENPVQLGINASLGGRRPFPSDNPWNQDVAAEPVDPNSDLLIASIGRDKTLFASFGQPPAGIPYVVVPGTQSRAAIRFEAAAESDAGPYPIPTELPYTAAQLGKDSWPLLVIDRDNWKLYELNRPQRDAAGWRAYSGAIFDLNSNALRPLGWTSADAAGLPIFPGLVRYDEVVEQKAIRHALRFSASRLRAAWVQPARHSGSHDPNPALPPLGMKVRLRADYDVSSFPPSVQVILMALKKHGMILAEYGSDWYISGTADPRWNDKELKTLQRVRGQDFEVVRMGKIETRR